MFYLKRFDRSSSKPKKAPKPNLKIIQDEKDVLLSENEKLRQTGKMFRENISKANIDIGEIELKLNDLEDSEQALEVQEQIKTLKKNLDGKEKSLKLITEKIMSNDDLTNKIDVNMEFLERTEAEISSLKVDLEKSKRSCEKSRYPSKTELFHFEQRFTELFDASAHVTFHQKLLYDQLNSVEEQKTVLSQESNLLNSIQDSFIKATVEQRWIRKKLPYQFIKTLYFRLDICDAIEKGIVALKQNQRHLESRINSAKAKSEELVRLRQDLVKTEAQIFHLKRKVEKYLKNTS